MPRKLPERFHDITVRLVSDDETPVDTALLSKTVFFHNAFSLQADVVVAPLSEDVTKDSSLGRLWHAVKPCDGQLVFEIATVLPFFLPTIKGRAEYIAHIKDTELVVCSRMKRCFYTGTDTSTNPLEYFLVHQLAIKDLPKEITAIHPIPLNTFVTKRFDIQANSAEQAVRDGFCDWRNHFLQEVSSLIDAMRSASIDNARRLLPQFAGPSFPMLWLVIQGANDTMGIAQFCGDLEQAAFRPVADLDDESTSRFHQYLREGATVPVHDSSVSLATTFLHYGYVELALIQICTACEAVLGQMYENFLMSRGVSKTKYNDAKQDITFSQLLNLHLAAVCNLQNLEGRENVLGKLNWARSCRNEILHEGRCTKKVTTKEVEGALEAAKRLINFVLPRESNKTG